MKNTKHIIISWQGPKATINFYRGLVIRRFHPTNASLKRAIGFLKKQKAR